MAKFNYVTTNFTAGELSPRLRGRTDVARYQNGTSVMRNFIPQVYGGIKPRPGTRYVAAAKSATKDVRLIPFVTSAGSYVIEFGDLYFRFFTSGAQILSAPTVPYELAHTYTEAQLRDVNYVQAEDSLILVHPSHRPRRLRRYSNTNWLLDDVPLDPAPYDEVGTRVTPTAGTLSAATVGTGRTLTAGSAYFVAADVGRAVTCGAGYAVVTGYTSTTVVTVEITAAFDSTTLTAGTWWIRNSPQTTCTPSGSTTVIGGAVTLTLAAAGFRIYDLLSHVEINDGLVYLTGYTSDTVMTGVVLKVLASTTAAPADAWVLKQDVWRDSLGYPRAVTLFEQRLVFAGTATYPDTVWGSRTGLPFDFTLWVNDDDAFAINIQVSDAGPIRHLVAKDALIALTERSEITMQGGVERPLTPTNVQIKQRSNYGTGGVRPAIVGNEVLFTQRAGRKIRALKYDIDSDVYVAPDITVLSEHITEGGVVEIAYQQEPTPLVWAVLGDGYVAACTFDRDQEVVAWSSQDTESDIGGSFISVCSIPSSDSDQVWVVVERDMTYVSPVRMIEYFSDDVQLDSAIVGSGSATTTWTGLDHLSLEVVYGVADGEFVGPFIVDGSGEVELDTAASVVQFGLSYIPEVTLLPPEIPGIGSFQGQQMRVHEMCVRVLDTETLTIDGYQQTLDAVPFTGVVRSEMAGFGASNAAGWSRENEVTLKVEKCLPCHILSVSRKLTVNDT